MTMLLLNVMTRCSLVTVLHRVCGVLGCGHWLALARHKLLPSSATLLPAADNPHHVSSVLQTLNNYLPSRLSSPGTTLHWLVVLLHAIQASLCCLFIT